MRLWHFISVFWNSSKTLPWKWYTEYIPRKHGIDGKHVHTCVIARSIYSVLHFRICVLSHGRDRSTRGERNRTTLFTHELLSVRSIAYRNQQITTVSAEKKKRQQRRRVVDLRCDRSLAAGYEKAHRTVIFDVVFTIEGGTRNSITMAPQISRLDDSRDSLRELPAAKNRYHS